MATVPPLGMTPAPCELHQRRAEACGRTARRRACLLLAMLVLWQVLATSFHLATERHLAIVECGGARAVVELAAQLPGAAEHPAAARRGDDPVRGLPHAPHAAIDHQVAQDRVEDDPSPLPTGWLPMVVAPRLPPASIAGYSPWCTDPPPTAWRRAATAARAPPRA